MAFKIFGRNLSGSTSGTASSWVRANVNPSSFSGSYAALQQTISTQADTCAAVAKQQGFFVGNNTARQLCLGELNNAYAPLLNELQAASMAEDINAKADAEKSRNNIYFIAIGIAIILIIILL